MEKKKIRIITEVEVEYNPDLVSLDDIVSGLDYSFRVWEGHADMAEIKNTEIVEWN